MTQLDFKRIDEIMKHVDEYYFQSSIGRSKFYLYYLNSLKALYRYLRPLMKGNDRTKYDNKFSGIKSKIIQNKDDSMFMKIEELHDEIMNVRQFSGIGLFAYKYTKDPTEAYMKRDLE